MKDILEEMILFQDAVLTNIMNTATISDVLFGSVAFPLFIGSLP